MWGQLVHPPLLCAIPCLSYGAAEKYKKVGFLRGNHNLSVSNHTQIKCRKSRERNLFCYPDEGSPALHTFLFAGKFYKVLLRWHKSNGCAGQELAPGLLQGCKGIK